MKRFIVLISLIACMLLTACGKDIGNSAIASQKSKPGVSEVVLYEGHDLKLTMKAIYSIQGHRKSIVLNLDNDHTQPINVKCDQWIFNGTYVLSESALMYLDPLEDGKKVMEEMSELVYSEAIDSVREVCFHLSITDENYDMIDEQDVHIEFDKNLIFELNYNAYLGAKVDTQILKDDEYAKITLLEWGWNPDNNYIETVISVENTSDETIPVMISGMNINGIFFQLKTNMNHLEPGQKCFLTDYLLVSEFEDEGITSIGDIELIIMTDESENTGIVSYTGGSWYPVVLAEKGENAEVFLTGEPLESLEDVHISYVGQSETEWSDGGGYYAWNLAVVNDSDENVQISMIDVLIDGIPEETWHDQVDKCTLYFAGGEVGAHSNRNVSISLSCYEALIERPELTFKFQIRSMAGGAVIATGEEVITITPD